MTDEAFLRAILAYPEDDTPRLIYADWLEERGDPRAELLRQVWHLPRLSFIDWDWVQEQANVAAMLKDLAALCQHRTTHATSSSTYREGKVTFFAQGELHMEHPCV